MIIRNHNNNINSHQQQQLLSIPFTLIRAEQKTIIADAHLSHLLSINRLESDDLVEHVIASINKTNNNYRQHIGISTSYRSQ